jgi:predicted Zn finger-like uncharacterized protein
MKITCESCQAKYTIADEKVVGKIVKIKCKKCGTTIVVNGNEAGAQASASAPPAAASSPPHGHGGEEEAATRVFGNQGLGGGEQIDEWTVNVTDDDQRTMAAAQVAQEYESGLINGDTYVWRDGMPDWLPLCEVSELMALINATPSQRPQALANTPTPLGLGGPMQMGYSSPAAAGPFGGRLATPSPSAARRAGGRAGGIDVFGAAAQQQEAPKSSRPPPAADDKAIGERNENSVLFSLSALTAAENAAKVQTTKKADDASLDFRPSPMGGGGRNNGRAGLDDIMNLGGGNIGGMLAPPSLNAPFIEPPPPPPPPVSAQPSYQPMGAPMMMAPPAPQKSKAPLIIGAVAGLAVIGGLVLAFSSPSTPEVPTSPEQTVATTPTAAPTPTDTVAAAPTDTAAAADPTSTATSVAAPVRPGGATPGHKGPEPKAAPEDTKPAEPAKAEAPPPTKPAETAPPSGDGAKEFNRGAASAALGSAAGAAKSCKRPDGPTGTGKVRVTFAPSGTVTSSAVVGGPFAGTSVGGCIASAFRSARVPPFAGSPVSVTKSFSIN